LIQPRRFFESICNDIASAAFMLRGEAGNLFQFYKNS